TKQTELREGKLDKLPFEDNYFDAVNFAFMSQLVKTRKEKEKIIDEMLRVVKKGGVIVLLDGDLSDYDAILKKKNGEEVRKRKSFRFWPSVTSFVVSKSLVFKKF